MKDRSLPHDANFSASFSYLDGIIADRIFERKFITTLDLQLGAPAKNATLGRRTRIARAAIPLQYH